MWISQALAQTTDGAPANNQSTGGSGALMQFLPLILIFVIFYFLLIRPQQRKMREHRAMIAGLRRGDKVLTSGGLIGTVNKVVSDTEILLEIAENVRIRVARSAVNEILSRTNEGKEQDQSVDDKKEKDSGVATATKK
ncbi:MAG: preprotein translocase subunit YajC [Alphaproteobacteria bacterium]|jgi:preprotein translocase subunit YajC|nr:preprotein translocase subunit YajC [Alphaproteobacteria bacterium]